MRKNFQTIINKFSRLKILVIGEAMLDTYLMGISNRLCREAPVPIVDLKKISLMPGGAANTASNAAALGARVTFLSCIGDDSEGRKLNKILKNNGIDLSFFFKDKKRNTLSKKRIFVNDQLIVRYDSGSKDPINKNLEGEFIKALKKIYDDFDAIIISDYGYGILTSKIRNLLKKLQSEKNRVLAVDPKYLNLYKDFQAFLIKPNFNEAAEFLKFNHKSSLSRVAQVLSSENQIRRQIKSKIIAVTLDKEGAVIFEKEGSVYHSYVKGVKDSKAVGAGDSYTAAFTLSLAAGASGREASQIASLAGEIIVSKDQTAVCTAKELNSYLISSGKYIPDNLQIEKTLDLYRKENKKIVFTNGCFDILHSGHINFLKAVKQLGDILIVGINSDAGVTRLKGTARPINKLFDRIMVLSALSTVDYIVPFDEDLPIKLIKKIKPNVFAKGGDYKMSDLPEKKILRKMGIRIEIIPYFPNHSTTGIIEKIQSVI